MRPVVIGSAPIYALSTLSARKLLIFIDFISIHFGNSARHQVPQSPSRPDPSFVFALTRLYVRIARQSPPFSLCQSLLVRGPDGYKLFLFLQSPSGVQIDRRMPLAFPVD